MSMTHESALERLIDGNKEFIKAQNNPADISPTRRLDTAQNGQKPYAVIVTCSDSRVAAEHIFSAGIGELFIIRTAGNVVGNFELGSIEYAVEHLGVKLILILGHSGCGAAIAAFNDVKTSGNLTSVIDEISSGIVGAKCPTDAIKMNVNHSLQKVLDINVVGERVKKSDVNVLSAIYDMESGVVELI